MKSLVFSLMLVFGISNFCFAQKIESKNIPAQLSNDFKSRFPEATNTKWLKEGKHLKALFTKDGNKMVAWYDNNTWVKTEWCIPNNIAPLKIKEYISKYYNGYKINEIGFVETINSEREYEAEISKKKKNVTKLIFDISGNFIRIDEQK